MQTVNSEEVYAAVKKAQKNRVRAQALKSVMYPKAVTLAAEVSNCSKPKIAMLVGTGVNPLDAGEIWHLLDQRFYISRPHTWIYQLLTA
jgi:hypothetical protein